MTQRKTVGMRIRQVPNSRKSDILWLVQGIVALLACVALTLTVNTLTGNPWPIMLFVIVWLCIAYGILLKTKHESWFYMGSLLLLLVLILLCRKQVLEGFRIFWNHASDPMLRGTGWVLPEWELQMHAEQSNLCVTLFAVFASAVIALICCALTSYAPVLLALLLPAVLLWGLMIFGIDESVAWLLPVLGISVLILMYSGWRKKGAAAPVIMGWFTCALVTSLLMVGTYLPGVQNWVVQIREEVHQTIHEKKYETRYTTLPEGDFSSFQKEDSFAVQALAVTMDTPQQMYLRGFTGDIFTGESWKPLDKDALVKNKQFLYWLNQNAFNLNAQFDAAAAYAQTQKSTVTIQNIGACSYYRYVPFSISRGAWAQDENLNTDGVHADAERNYVYSVASGNAETIMQVLNYLQTSEDPAVLQYRKAESGYRQFIHHYYTQVPEEVKMLLSQHWDAIAGKYGSANNLTLQQAQECAVMFLSKCFPEEGTPDDLVLPLEIAEGTTYQYATVAALTLRYFGIPARYAEGYVITEKMASAYESGETITVDSSCAKAWVEVYQDGIGWIPMDLTPGMDGILGNIDSPDQNENAVSPGADSTQDNQTAEWLEEMLQEEQWQDEEEPEEELQEELNEQPESNNENRMQLLRNLLLLLLTLLIVFVLLFLILAIRRRVICSRKEKRFASENFGDAVAWIYADTAILLEKLGFDRENGSMRALRGSLETKFGEDFAVQFDLVSDLNDRALFSSLPMEKEHRKTVRKFHSWVLRKLNTEVKWYRRMWLKWGLCLY